MKLLNQILGNQLLLDQHANSHKYPDGFWFWLQCNHHVWEDFEKKSLDMAQHRKRFSARTIVEVMRWNNDIRQKNPLFKISNNMTPGMARLWMAKHGDKHPKFFSIQEK